MNELSLITSSVELIPLKDEFIQFAMDTEADKIHLGDFDLLKRDPAAYLLNVENQSKGIDLPEGWIPHTRYWYILNGNRIIGSVDMRHYLTPISKIWVDTLDMSFDLRKEIKGMQSPC